MVPIVTRASKWLFFIVQLRIGRFLGLAVIVIMALILVIMGVILVGMMIVVMIEIVMVLGVLLFGGLLAYTVCQSNLSEYSENYPPAMYKLLL